MSDLAVELRELGRHTELMSSMESEGVNYDSPPLLEVEIEGVDYRLDAGKQGTALYISTRPAGTWDFQFAGEARWDVGSLRCKAFERRTLDQLSRAFKEALELAG